MKNKRVIPYTAGIIGALLLLFIGWEYNIPAIAWVSYPLLVYSFRSFKKWYLTLPLVVLMAVVRFVSIYGGWDMELWLTIIFSVLVLAPLLAGLYLDRAFVGHLSPILASLVFPCTYIVFDYLLTFMNLGMTFSLVYSQATFLEFIQVVSVFGSWFAGFVTAWFAPVAVLLVQNTGKLKTIRRPLIVYFTILSVILLFGCFRLALARPHSETVRIASVTEEHRQDYWTITDRNTPRGDSPSIKPEMKAIEDKLFKQSQKAVDYGAEIIFWSEGDSPMYEDDYDAFIKRASDFARENRVWFVPACVMLRYDRNKNDNLAIIFEPEGKMEYRYEKTISWYPTDSDGKLPVIQTPYGKLSAAICFDMDYPRLISQASDADIMLVPGYDTKKISDFHTRVSFLRGIENGFSVVRQANESASISADYLGNTLTYQNYFYTPDRIMISDVPVRGVWTLYGFTGEIFLWIDFAGFALIVIISLRKMLLIKRTLLMLH
ncbi:MAG TPA: nitrilase-related carbon-nitrogen hydrolase [Clostridia bacterium]|nr:nitrilase-related carbon-nitrogen hydrolase [Clostridia bacterium]